jgi:DNA-binding NtrC family response regulator
MPLDYSILIVEDDPDLLEILGRRFVRQGFSVKLASHPQQALSAARSNSYRAAILDYTLPDMNGQELMRELAHVKPDLPVILLSGHCEPELEAEAMQLGAYAYLRKPCRLVDLEEVVQRAIEEPYSASEDRAVRQTKTDPPTRSLQASVTDPLWPAADPA